MDVHSLFVAENLCKKVIGLTLTPLLKSEIDNHNQKAVELAIQVIKSGSTKIGNACTTGVMA